MAKSEARIDHRYLGVLCAASLGILVAGVWFRPSRTPPPVPSELERLNVQIASQRLDLDRRSVFYTRKVEDLLPLLAEARVHPERIPFLPGPSGKTILLVGHDATRQSLWAVTQTVGAIDTQCGEMVAHEIATTIAIPATLADAAAFDLDNNLAGLVIPCGDRRILSSPSTFSAWTAAKAIQSSLYDCCGIRVTDDLVLTELQPESALAKSGVRAADRLAAIGGQPLTSREGLLAALTASPPPAELTVHRGERTRKLTIHPPQANSQ